MNDTQSSLPSESSKFKDVAGSQVEGSARPKSIGVYDQPERRGLSPLVIGLVALLIVAIVFAIVIFQVLN